jgi:hypothetical protein
MSNIKCLVLRVFLPAVLGSAATALAFMVLVIPTVRDNHRAQGQNEGSIKG